MLSRVLHELGEQVCHVLGLWTSNGQLVESDWNDTAVVLDLTDCDTEHFLEWNRWAVTLWRLGISENQEALGVTMHSSCEVVNSVEQCQFVGVPLFSLECVDGFELAIYECLVTTSQVDVGI